MADSQWRTRIRIPKAAIGDWDPSPDLCNVNIQHITIVPKGKLSESESGNVKESQFLR